MLVKLVELKLAPRTQRASLGEIYINPRHIVSVTLSIEMGQQILREHSHLLLNDGVEFSKLVLLEGNTTRSLNIVGTPQEVYQKINNVQLLKG